MKTIEQRIEDLQKLTEVQCDNGNWNYAPYMMGLANGLILALHMIRDDEGEPPFKSQPDEWLCDRDAPSIEPDPCDATAQ